MKTEIDLSQTKLSEESQNAVSILCDQLQEALKDQLESIILYGSALTEYFKLGQSDVNILIVLKNVDTKTMNKVLEPLFLSKRYGVSPLFLTQDGVISSTKVFPIKFLSMQENYKVLMGDNVLEDLSVDKKNLHFRCQQETLNLLMRLRRHYLTSGGSGLPDRITRVIGHFLETLKRIISLSGELPVSNDEVLEKSEQIIGLDKTILQKALDYRKHSTQLSHEDGELFFDDFLKMVTQATRYTERLQIDEI
jgi:hypothetical protein